MRIKLHRQRVYGQLRYYPECTVTRALCRIVARKTLLESDVQELLAVGFDVEISG
jgi:hypothetical protein